MGSAAGPRAAGARLGRFAGAAWSGLLLLSLIFLVVYPVTMLVLGALTRTNPVADGFGVFDLSIDNFITVVASPDVQAAVVNTLIVCIGGTGLAVAIGLAFAWIVTRTNTPMKGLIESAGVMPLFVPPLVAGVAWSILASPTTGLLNVGLKAIGVEWRFDVYSIGGMIVVFGMYYAPYVYMFVGSALRNMDPSLEEAAAVSGAGPTRTMLTVTFPLIAPAVLAGMLLSFVVMIGIYGIPAVLAMPAKIPILTTYIYQLTSWSPPQFNTAAAVAILLIGATVVGVLGQQWLLAGRSFVTVSGKSFKPRQLDLGPWRWVTLGLACLYLFVVVVLPTIALLIGAFRKFLFIPTLESLFDWHHYALMHFESLFDNPLTLRSIWNSLKVGLLTAVIGGALAFALGYTINRTQAPGRRWLDVLSSLPIAIPGLVVGVAYVWAWIGLPGGLWGTIWILALSFVARFIPDTVKALSTSLMQIHKDLEEASTICGRGVLATIWRIVLPIARPGVLAAMSLLFILSVRELGSSLFLFTSQTQVMAVLLLDYYEGGNIGIASAFSIVQTVLLLLVVSSTNYLGRASDSVGRSG